MTKSQISLFIYGIYFSILGLVMIFIPNQFLTMIGLSPSYDFWLMLLGYAIAAHGGYYAFGGLKNLKPYMKISILGRTITFIFFVIIIAMKIAPINILIFGVLELLGAIWTAIALQADKKKAQK